jgi:hypothetical protein
MTLTDDKSVKTSPYLSNCSANSPISARHDFVKSGIVLTLLSLEDIGAGGSFVRGDKTFPK